MQGEEKTEEVKVVKVTISYNKTTGSITVDGPLEDKIFCFGLLEIAKEVIKDFKNKK